MIPEPDTDILGLQWTLREHLSERGFEQHDHYASVDGDMGNAEIAIALRTEWGGAIQAAVCEFANANRFPFVFLDQATNVVYLRRRAEVD